MTPRKIWLRFILTILAVQASLAVALAIARMFTH